MSNKGLRVEEGRTKLIASHKDKEITFISPAKGPNNYVNVAEQITQEGLKQPTMGETASLVHSAWQNPEDKYSKNIINILRKNWLWGFTGNLYVPNEGVYIQDNPQIVNGNLSMNKKGLVNKLEANDNSVRFVPFGFKLKIQSALELAKNPYIIGLAGEEGADKLAQVAEEYRTKPYVWSFNNVDNEITRVSLLLSYWDDDRLVVVGDCRRGWNGFAFGVLDKASEAGSGRVVIS